MNHIYMTDHRFDVRPLLEELAAAPELWGQIPHRTTHPQSPHRDVQDIWVRYNPLENFRGEFGEFNGPHTSEWYPCVEKIPSARRLAEQLKAVLCAVELGGVLITKVPAGKQVFPHVDRGWHAGYYDRKYIIQIAGNHDQWFGYSDRTLSALPGECYYFENHVPHWVVNNSNTDRVSLIVCLRGGGSCH